MDLLPDDPDEELEPVRQKRALVIGGGIAGIQAATDVAVQGFPVTIVEKGDRLGGRLAEPSLKYLDPNMVPAAEVLDRKLKRLKKSKARVVLNTEIESITGFVGNFEVRCYDELLGRRIDVPTDMVVLSIGMRPAQPATDVLHEMLKAPVGLDGFFLERHPELAPVGTSVEGVLLAGTAHGPKDIVDSVAQASAAAAKASVFVAADAVKLQATIGEVEQAECSNCGLCASVCPFQAIQWEKKEPAQLVKALCAGCGTCAAAWPIGAITMRHFTDDQLLAQVHAMLEEHPRDKVVVFACNWCSYAGAHMAGISRLQYPPTGHLIRTMCSGRVSEEMVLEAFRCGAPVVLVSGCHYADCHYIDANRQTVERVQKLWNKLERASVRPERLQLEWISAAEGQKFAEVMARMETLRTTVTEGEVAHAKEALKPKPKKIPMDRASRDGRSTNST